MKVTFVLLAGLTAWLALAGCKKDKKDPVKLNLEIAYEVDGQPLYFDSLLYRNAAGEQYSVSTLRYYISNIRFYNRGTVVYAIDTVWYADAALTAAPMVLLNVAGTRFDSVACFIGIDPVRNVHGKLAPTMENTAMEWPDMMGGGYHFLKLEGHWVSATGISGYAMHIGTDPYLTAAGCRASGAWPGNGQAKLQLVFNVAEWFRNPYTYSFASDGVYSMGNAALMQHLKENGADVIHIRP